MAANDLGTQVSVAPRYYDERASVLFAEAPLTRMRRVCARRAEQSDDETLVARLQDAEAIVTQITALQAVDLAELRWRRVVSQSESGAVGPAADEDGWVVTEVGVALALSDRQMHERLATAHSLQRYSTVQVAMSTGRLQAWTAQRLIGLLDELAVYVTHERLRQVEQSMVGWLLAESRTVTQLASRMRRLIIKVRGDAGDDSDDDVAARHATRRVSVTCERDGTANLWARLPEADALALARALDQQARRPADDHDERSVAQRQADLLVAAVTGAPALWGHDSDVPGEPLVGTGVTTRLNVTIPIQSLLADGTEPADVPGHGAIPAATARQVAGADDVEARPIIYDGDTGRLLGLGAYLPATRWWSHENWGSRITWGADIAPASGYAHPRLMDDFRLGRRRRTEQLPALGHPVRAQRWHHAPRLPHRGRTRTRRATLLRVAAKMGP